MRINFNKIEIHNFMSFADETFDYDKHKGMNLICGKNNDIPGAKNGTGKSTLFSALVFCLFGETQNKIKNENVHNRYVDTKEVRVVTHFTIDNDCYKVASGFNKYGAAYCNVMKIVDGNEIDMTKSSIIETRKLLEKEILHCDMSIFLRTIMLSSDQTYNFFRLRKGEKKEFIEKLFDISVFGQMYNSIHHDILNFDKKILAQQSKLMMLNKSNGEYMCCMSRYDEEQKAKVQKIEETLKSITERHSELKNKKIASNSEEAKKYEDAVDKINDAICKVNKAKQALHAQATRLDVSIHKLNSSRDQKKKVVDKHQELLGKLCNDCKQIFSDYYSISAYSKDIEEIDCTLAKLSDDYNTNAEKSKLLEDKLSALNDKLTTANAKIKSLTEEFVKTNKELMTYETRIESLNNDLTAAKSQQNPYVSLFEGNKRQIQDETDSLISITDQYKYLKFAESIVSQDTLRKFIIKDLIGLLNNKIRSYLTKLGAKYTVVFDSDMDYEFITDAGTCEYDNFSAGERQRIMIATCFAFRDFMAIRNNLSSNILILDEFIDGNIDALAIEGVISILRDFILLYNQNIYVVSHRKEVDNSIFNNIIQVQKTNNISKIAILDV